ncbi:MAG TPA: aldo/keto reductase [Candidatus Thermoplasmatota archaeon]|nr:aldo/keto reductase [Candidatus Thermoplasmatota archaeon]
MVDVEGVRIPPLVYGTAWKEERTAPLVAQALRAGFRGIDTANQRKHYHEAGVGQALREAFASGLVRREELFLQTKFTYRRGQDHRLPYDPEAPLAEQVAQSCESSLAHLGVDALDAYLLHGPSAFPHLGEDDLVTWRAMEELHALGKVRLLGVSNVTAQQLATLHAAARVKPRIVQNRTFTRPHADAAVRAFCAEHGLVYEGFSLLTAIPHVLAHPTVVELAMRHGRTPAEAIFAYCLARGMVVLTGTTSEAHMRQDLAAPDLRLDARELALLDALVA